MNTPIREMDLRDGSRMTIVEVEAPDACYRDRVLERLAHKPSVWLWQVALALDGQNPGLGARFYLPEIDGRVAGNISCWQTGPVGLISHVFTDEAYRGRGIASAVMAEAIARLAARGARVLSLLTGPHSRPFRIYQRAGFRAVREGAGHMVREHEPGDLDRLFDASRALQVRPAVWSDWPGTAVLYCVDGGGALRSVRHGVCGPSCFEAEFLYDCQAQHSGRRQQFVLESGGVVGAYASLGPDPRWADAVWLLDLFAHPRLVDRVPELLATVDWPDVKTQCYVGADQAEVARALEQVGFGCEARLGEQIRTVQGDRLQCCVLRR